MADIMFLPQQTNVLDASRRFPFDMRVLQQGADRKAAYGVRYRAYRNVGYIAENPEERYSDAADAWPTTIVLAAHDADVCVGVIRVCLSQKDQPITTLPCAPYFPAINKLKADAKGTVAEVGRLAIEPDIKNTSYRTTLFASLVRAAVVATKAADASDIIVTTVAGRTEFHTKMLGFKAYGEPAFYPPGDLPITMLVGSRDDAELKQRAQNAFFRITDDEVASMRDAILPSITLRKAA